MYPWLGVFKLRNADVNCAYCNERTEIPDGTPAVFIGISYREEQEQYIYKTPVMFCSNCGMIIEVIFLDSAPVITRGATIEEQMNNKILFGRS